MPAEDLLIRVAVIGAAQAAAETDGVTVSLDRMGVAGATANKEMKGLGSGLTGMKALFAGMGIYEVVKQFAGFQSQMEKLKTQTGATQTEVGKMSKGILGMAVSVGTGPMSLAQAMYHIQSAGFRGKEALDALTISAKGAKIGGAELVDTTTAMTAVMVAGFKGTKTLQEAMGQLNATVGAGDMTMQDLNDALGTGILATMKGLGLEVKDTGAALAVLGDNNIRGAQAATRLRMGLMQLVHPSTKATEAIEGLHMKQLQLAEDMRKPNGLLVMLQDLHKHLGPLNTAAEKTQAMSSLSAIFGGGRNSSAMFTLLEQLDRLKTKYAAVEKGGKGFNADWKATTKTLQFFLDQIKTLGEVALIKLGAGIGWVVGKIRDLVEGFQKGKLWAVVIVGALAGIAGMLTLMLIPALIAGAGAATGLMVALAFNPLVWIAVAIGVLVMLIVKTKVLRDAFVDAWHWIKTAGLDAFHWIETAASNAFNWLKHNWPLVAAILLGPIALAAFEIVKHWDAILHFFEGLPSKMLKVAKAIGNAIWEGFKWGIDKVIEGFEMMIHDIGLPGISLGPIKFGGVHPFASVHLPRMELGGLVSASGPHLVGERGPEIVHLNRGSYVQPNNEIGQPAAGAPGVLEATIINVLDGRQVSRSVVRQGLMAQSCR